MNCLLNSFKGDPKCIAVGGKCSLKSKKCIGGVYELGLCNQDDAANRECCVPFKRKLK